MDPLHIHLFLNHVPVVGGIGALMLLAWGLVKRSADVTVAALAALILVAVLTVPAFLAGDEARKRIEGLDGVSLPILHEHRDAAVAAMVGMLAAAAIAAAALFAWQTTHRYPMFAATAALVVGLAASILVVRAAELGGEVRHTELRAPVAPVHGR